MSPVTYYATGRDENGELMLTAANPNGSNYMRLRDIGLVGTTAINFRGLALSMSASSRKTTA